MSVINYVSLNLEKPDERDQDGYVFHTNGEFLYQSDYTVQDEAAEENEMTSINGNTYIGVLAIHRLAVAIS